MYGRESSGDPGSVTPVGRDGVYTGQVESDGTRGIVTSEKSILISFEVVPSS